MTLPHIGLLAGIGVVLLVVGIMEIVAIVSHKWVMHGFLWSLHKSHHEPRTGMFEKNDWFAVMGAVPSIILLIIGTGWDLPLITAIGAGITAYGAIYFGFHDVLVHRRAKHGWNPQQRYLKRIVQAHRLHHVVESKDGTVSYGFLYAPPIRVLKAQLEANGKGRLRSSSKIRREMDLGRRDRDIAEFAGAAVLQADAEAQGKAWK